jgi:hypothetical protein
VGAFVTNAAFSRFRVLGHSVGLTDRYLPFFVSHGCPYRVTI